MTCDASLRGEANANALRTKQLAHRFELLDVIADRFDDHQDRNAQQKAGDSHTHPKASTATNTTSALMRLARRIHHGKKRHGRTDTGDVGCEPGAELRMVARGSAQARRAEL